MSTKGSKRRQRRINTNDEDSEKKNDETIEISDDNKSTKSTDTERDISLKELKEELKENGEKSPKSKSALEAKVEENKKDENIIIIEEKTNGQPENGTSTTNDNQVSQDENSDLEPLVLDTEEQELQFTSETGSEASEIEKSPTLNRCKTRRSQSRNLPTPKTPKTLDFNGETDKEVKDTKDNDARLQPTIELEENEEKSENVSVISIDISVESSFSEKTQDTDVTNASTIAHVGDTTRNLDITTTTIDETINSSNFIDLTKDKSYGETLRCLTGRKNLRKVEYQPRFYKSNIDLRSKDFTDSSNKYSTIRSASIKRKLEHDSPGESKKAKASSSSNFFSYLTNPFMSKTNRTDPPSSTPKLTGFKFVHQGSNQIDEVEKIEFEATDNINSEKLGDKLEDKNAQPKKWCTVM